jgi:DNA protecting protein DprA
MYSKIEKQYSKMTNDNEIYDVVYQYMNIKGIGTVQTNKVLHTVSEPLEPYHLRSQLRLSLNPEQQAEYEKAPSVIEHLKTKFEVGFIMLTSDQYPTDLRKYLSTNTPPILSYIGNTDLLNKRKVGFSGSRKVSEKGIAITKDCVEQLTQKDVCIVSGYAAGVDFEAHYRALSHGGSTIVILPEGINSFRIKKEMKEVWDWKRVLVISEFKPDEPWKASRAMQRNNTIIGLSDIMVVVEAGETGGSLDAGFKTLQMQKLLFVPQYGVVPESALGNSKLLNIGAFSIKRSPETQKANLNKMFEWLGKSNKYELFD